ncbi:MAG TPA: hypothetical protein VN962_15645 [Polyangia bacterium]|nr:hypothetical protein [Polyangia bacterium]
MRGGWGWRLARWLAVVTWVGCGGGGQGQPSGAGGGRAPNGVPIVPDGVEPIESFAADTLAAQCAVNVRCHRSATVEGCVAASLPPLSPRVALDVRSGVIRYDPHLAYRCIQLISVAPCTGGADLESCHDAFTGTLPGGSTCSLDAECASGDCAMPGCTTGCCPPGTCTDGLEARNIPVGATCAFGGCGEGEYCDVSGRVCRPRVGKGGSCAGAICQSGLVCSNTSSTCVTPAAVGGSCLGNFCDGDGTCTAAGTCAAAPALGDPCSTAGACGLALNCIDGVCVMPGALGQPCVGDVGTTQCQHGIVPAGINETVTCVQGACAYADPSPPAIDCLSP